MLILQRKVGQSLKIGENITVSVVSVDGGRVRLSIEAPSEISIMRSELLETKKANQEAVLENVSADALLELLGDVKAP